MAIRNDTDMPLTFKDAALDLATGFNMAVFPLAPKSKVPHKGSRGFYDATKDEVAIREAWKKQPYSNVGIATGKPSGIIAFDCDTEAAFDEAAQRGLPTTWIVKTSRGYQVYLRRPEWADVPTIPKDDPQQKRADMGIAAAEIKADGGYVVAPPSIHPDGPVYQWEVSPDEAPLGDAPDWVLDILRAKLAKRTPQTARPNVLPSATTADAGARTIFDQCLAAVRSATEGGRNNILVARSFTAGQLIGARRLDRGDAERALLAAALSCGLGETAATKTIASGINAGIKEPLESRPLPALQIVQPKPAPTVPIGTVEPQPEDDEDDAPSPLLDHATYLGDLGWITEYIDITGGLTNAPDSFNRLCGLVTVATAIGHRAVLRMAFGDIRPNIYAAIIAPSTVHHKSAAIWQGQKLLSRAGQGELLFASQFTSEGLLAHLSEHPAGVIFRDEIGTLFAAERVKYLAMLKQDLTAIYDGEDYSRQLARDRITVRNPYLNILGATTPARFYDGVTLTDWQDGFMARWLFALPDREPDFYSDAATFTAEHAKKLDGLAATLRNISQQQPTDFVFDAEAFDLWNYCQKRDRRDAYLYGNDIISSIVGRYNTYALKFAMILAAVNGKWGRIDIDVMNQALSLAGHYKKTVNQLLDERQDHGINGAKLQKVFAIISSHGPDVRSRVIQQYTKMKANEVDPVLDKLVEIGAIVTSKATRGKTYTAVTDKLPIRSW